MSVLKGMQAVDYICTLYLGVLALLSIDLKQYLFRAKFRGEGGREGA